MARFIRPCWAIRCVNSSCKALFEVAEIKEEGRQQEVICPKCGEHYIYPIFENNNEQQQ